MSVFERKYFLHTLYFVGTGDWRRVLKIKREGGNGGRGKIRQNQGKHCPLWQPIHHGPLFGILLNRPEHRGFVCIDIFFWVTSSFPASYDPHPRYSFPSWWFSITELLLLENSPSLSSTFCKGRGITPCLCPSNLIFATWPASCQSMNVYFQRKRKISLIL